MRICIVALAAVLVAGCGVSSDVSRDLGARCDSRDDCNDRCVPSSLAETPGGFCSLQCVDDSECPNDAACADFQGGVCLFTCATNADCEFLGAGWACDTHDGLPNGEVMVCIGN